MLGLESEFFFIDSFSCFVEGCGLAVGSPWFSGKPGAEPPVLAEGIRNWPAASVPASVLVPSPSSCPCPCLIPAPAPVLAPVPTLPLAPTLSLP